MKIYLASPLFTDEQKKRINNVVSSLRELGHDVYSPVEYKVENAWELSPREWADKVFEEDIKQLDSADCVVSIYDGLISDTGTSWELGYATAKGKKIFVLITNRCSEQSLMVLNKSATVLKYENFYNINTYDWVSENPDDYWGFFKTYNLK